MPQFRSAYQPTLTSKHSKEMPVTGLPTYLLISELDSPPPVVPEVSMLAFCRNPLNEMFRSYLTPAVGPVLSSLPDR